MAKNKYSLKEYSNIYDKFSKESKKEEKYKKTSGHYEYGFKIFPHPGTLANSLLGWFVKGERLRASVAESLNLCPKNQFTEWVEILEKKEFVVLNKGKYFKVTPGRRLKKNIDREKLSHGNLITREEFFEEAKDLVSHEELAKKNFVTKQELEKKIDEAIWGAIDYYDPPPTQSKVNKVKSKLAIVKKVVI